MGLIMRFMIFSAEKVDMFRFGHSLMVYEEQNALTMFSVRVGEVNSQRKERRG